VELYKHTSETCGVRMGPLTVIGAPTNLGLRPPTEGSVPGCYKARWALEEAGVFVGVDLRDGGTAVPPRNEPAWRPGDGARNAEAMAAYSKRLSDRLSGVLDRGELVRVVGGTAAS
jgi:arginase